MSDFSNIFLALGMGSVTVKKNDTSVVGAVMIRHEVDTSHKVNFYSDIYNTKGKNGMRFLQKKKRKNIFSPRKREL